MGFPVKVIGSLLCVLVLHASCTNGLYWLLQNYGTGKCLHVVGESNADNSNLELVPCHCPLNGLNSSQVWWEDWSSGNTETMLMYYLTSAVHPMVATVNGGSLAIGAIVNTYTNLGQPNQKWKIINGQFGGNGAVFQIQNSQSGMCITAENGGTYIDQWTCIGCTLAPHQCWRVFG